MTDTVNRRRVLILSENAPVPTDRRVWNESIALTEAGYEVVVVCAAIGDRWVKPFEVHDGIEIHRYPLAPAAGGAGGYIREYAEALFRTRRLLLRLAADRHFDIVHACNPPDLLLLAALPLRRRGARFIFDHHDLVPELFRTRYGDRHRVLHRLTLAAEQLAFRLADVVLCTNESYRKVAMTRGHRHPDDVFVVRNGPDLSRFRPAEPDPALKDGRPHLISYLGVMAPQDGVDQAIRALAALRRRREDWRAIFMGDGESLEDMRRLADDLGVSDLVHFAGWTGDDEIRRVLASSDVCLAPEPPNPLNDLSTMIKVTEYMAMSRPIVAYDLAESRVSAGEAALFAPIVTPESFADCIDHLLSDPARRQRMGELGRARVERELAWEYSARRLRDAYTHVLDIEPRSVLRSLFPATAAPRARRRMTPVARPSHAS